MNAEQARRSRIGIASLGMALLFAVPAALQADDDLDFLLDAPAVGEKPKEAPSKYRKVAAGLHDGHSFGPRLRPDGAWVAYGVREQVKGTFKTSFYARPLDGDGLFRSVWPNAHPSFVDGEGTASFTDLVGFEWTKDGNHNAMVVQHKTKGAEVLLETMDVRFTGKGAQTQPAISADGTQVIVVSEAEDGSGTDLWVAPTTNAAEPLRITFTKESEIAPSWHPKEEKLIYELRNPLGGDIWIFDLSNFSQEAVVRLGTSDEVQPSFSPKGDAFAFLSNSEDPQGIRYDLFVKGANDALPRSLIQGVRRSEKSRGYAFDPLGRYVFAVLDDEAAGYPLVAVPMDGSKPPKKVVDTVDNMDPTLVPMEQKTRLVWVALDMDRPEDRRYRVIYVADFDLAALGEELGL